MADVDSPGELISLADAILLLDGVESETNTDTGRIAEYEQMFSQRFTDADVEYMTVLNSANPPPPCIENWYSRPKRTFDWSRGNSDHRRGGGYSRSWSGHSDRSAGSYHGERSYGRDDRSSGSFRTERNSGHQYNRGQLGGGRVIDAGAREYYGEPQTKYQRRDDREHPRN